MIITAILETIGTGELDTTTVECQDYTAGFEQLRRMVPEGVRLLNFRTQR